MKPHWSATTTAPFGHLCALPLLVRAEWLIPAAFDNKSADPALVKLVGPTTLPVEVPDGQSRTWKPAPGKYYILVRYGPHPPRYRCSRGEEKAKVAAEEYFGAGTEIFMGTLGALCSQAEGASEVSVQSLDWQFLDI